MLAHAIICTPEQQREMKSKKKIRFPKRELNSWLRSHHTGFGEWVGNPEGRDQVGLYLETHRR